MNKKNIFGIALAILFLTVISANVYAVKGVDSLRVGKLLKTMEQFDKQLKDDILPKLDGDAKDKVKELRKDLNKMLSESKNLQKDSLVSIARMNEAEKKFFADAEAKVTEIKQALPAKSEAYHLAALAHLPLYVAVQESSPDKIPLLETYYEPFDPNTSHNSQVMIKGAYLNFFLEYKINVGGIEMGPDIVDPERVVFTFPQKLLEGMTEPTWIEVKAAPHMMKGGKMVFYKEQSTFVLVYPRKKK